MQKIFKYPLSFDDSFTEFMHAGAKILTVQTQRNVPCIWAQVDDAAPLEPRHFRTVGTGWDMPQDVNLNYVGTFKLNGGALVFHLFEVV